jgi:4-nitrophenyl phosphatase
MTGTVPAPVAARLRAAKGFVFDMDGTLVLADPNHRGATALPGAAEMLREAAARGLPFVVFTNGANRPPAALAGMLNEAGLPVTPAQIMTPSSTAAALIRQSGARRVMMISSEAARAI